MVLVQSVRDLAVTAAVLSLLFCAAVLQSTRSNNPASHIKCPERWCLRCISSVSTEDWSSPARDADETRDDSGDPVALGGTPFPVGLGSAAAVAASAANVQAFR